VAAVAAGKVSRSGLHGDRGALFWVESRPSEGGRQVLVRWDAGPDGDGRPVDVTPTGASVRSRVHEYGGGAAVAAGGAVFSVDQDDQAWHVVDGPGPPRRLGPPAGHRPSGAALRHADGRPVDDGRWLVSVQEEVSSGGPALRLVAQATDGSGVEAVLEDGSDFVSAPRPSPDGRWLAWIAWDHPDMPWDRSVVRVAPLQPATDGAAGAPAPPVLGPSVAVAGGPDRSVGQPTWCPDGSLVVLDDRTGWWLPYRIDPADLAGGGIAGPGPAAGTSAEPLTAGEVELHDPDWALGQATLAAMADGSLAARLHRDGRDHRVLLRPPAEGPIGRPWRLEVLEQPCVVITGVATPDGRGLAVSGSTPFEANGVWAADGPTGRWHRISAPPSGSGGRATVGRPWTARVVDADGEPHAVPGILHLPLDDDDDGGATAGAPPPLVVICHGGPTGAFPAGYDPLVQCLTSRGIAVAGVDYRGSSGYGRAYRDALRGRWGEADVEDCAGYAAALAAAGLVDGGRMAIRGSSAGGLTALAALGRDRTFRGAVSWYGVTDLAALAADTHDFESRYLDGLVGPWPGAAAVYHGRSPLHQAATMAGSVLLLQGADDPVVPADQSERFAGALADAGVDCRLVVFPGESHGFRRAATIEAALEAELAFYAGLFARPAEGAP
jgi:dipeptidyl aminopeptidase/acylaminoacyl peptidase